MNQVGIYNIVGKQINIIGVGEYFESIIESDDPIYGEFADGTLTNPMAKLLNGKVINLLENTWVDANDLQSIVDDFVSKGYVINFTTDGMFSKTE